jgi:hypothetical protein
VSETPSGADIPTPDIPATVTPVPDTDTPGPEATAEQDAAVRSLLGLLRPDDLPMPEDVVRRLDATLAEERRAAASAPVGAPLTATSDPDTDWVAPVTVLPVGEDRARRAGPTRTLRILGAAAAAVVVVALGYSVLGHGLGAGTSTSASSAESSGPSAASDTAAGTVIRASGTAYTAATLAAQVDSLVAGARAAGPVPAAPSIDSAGSESASRASGQAATAATPGPTSAGATSTGPTGTGPQSTGPTSSPLTAAAPAAGVGSPGPDYRLTETTLAACVSQLTGVADVTALVVDHGTFAGKAADIVVLPTPDDPTTLDVWVLAPGCTATSADVIHFARIPAS